MKKILIAIIPILIVMCYVLTVMPSKASADELALKLYGFVYYLSSGEGVGPGKPVYVYDSPTHYLGYANTGEDSYYSWGFYPPFYVYKVRCVFNIGSRVYVGETIIDRTLYEDTRVDIGVQIQPEK